MRTATAAGAPWKALAELEHLDGDAVEVLRGLMDECPSITRQGGERFISTPAELAEARAALRVISADV